MKFEHIDADKALDQIDAHIHSTVHMTRWSAFSRRHCRHDAYRATLHAQLQALGHHPPGAATSCCRRSPWS